MTGLLRPLLLAAALLFSQHAAMLHGLSHAEQELALAANPDGKAPALGHGIDECVAYFTLAHALGNAAFTPPAVCNEADAQTASFDTVAAVTRVVFDSRAPPLSA